MNDSTSYVRMHVINFEPTYLALMDAVAMLDDGAPMCESRDRLAESVDYHREAMGLDADDLDFDVDFADMIEFEAGDR